MIRATSIKNAKLTNEVQDLVAQLQIISEQSDPSNKLLQQVMQDLYGEEWGAGMRTINLLVVTK